MADTLSVAESQQPIDEVVPANAVLATLATAPAPPPPPPPMPLAAAVPAVAAYALETVGVAGMDDVGDEEGENEEPSSKGSKKNAWTAEEDQMLTKVVAECGAGHWTKVAAHLPGRMGRQCRERWFNHLAPEVKKGGWSREEDQLIVAAVREHGTKWSTIQKQLPGRSDNSIKNRCASLVGRVGGCLAVPATGRWSCHVLYPLRRHCRCRRPAAALLPPCRRRRGRFRLAPWRSVCPDARRRACGRAAPHPPQVLLCHPKGPASRAAVRQYWGSVGAAHGGRIEPHRRGCGQCPCRRQ